MKRFQHFYQFLWTAESSALLNMADALEEQLLAAVETQCIIDSFPWAAQQSIEHTALVGTMKSLQVDGYVVADPIHTEFWQLTEEAEGYVAKGSPEAQLFASIPAEGSDDAALKAALGEDAVKIGVGKCMKNKWITKDKATGKYMKLVSTLCSLRLP